MRERSTPEQALLGETIRSARINGDTIVFVTDSRRVVTLEPEGDCCADAYFPEVEDPAWLAGQTVHSVSMRDFSTRWDPRMEQIDTEFLSISTHAGDYEVELRTEHNGYYGGWINAWVEDAP